MMYLSIFFAILATSLGVPLNGRIFGGQNAAPGQFPFIVALNDPDQFCDGSIISNQWVLTAGHCLMDINENATVLVGTNSAKTGGTLYNIAQTIIHEDFDMTNGKNDVGLIKIDGELEYSDLIQPISFVDPEVNTTCTALGWGVTESVDFPEDVQYVELTTIDFDYCKELSGAHLDGMYLGPEQVCTLSPEGKGTCFGDSGGPLVCEGKLAGVVSYGVVACAQGYPDVFTKPSVYADWIQGKIQN